MDSECKYVHAVKNVLLQEYSSPSVELIRFLANRVCSPIPKQQVIDQFAPIVKEAFKQFISDHINDRLKSVVGVKEIAADHISSDEEFEGFYVVNVT